MDFGEADVVQSLRRQNLVLAGLYVEPGFGMTVAMRLETKVVDADAVT